MREAADLVEIFSSIQGEGLYVGSRQIFVRFFECNIECIYCDTPVGRVKAHGECIAEKTPGKRDFYRIKNPVDASRLDEAVSVLETFRGLHHSISITGGEPLLQTDFLGKWLPDARKRFRIYLETNGTLHKELAVIIGLIDIVAMDIKLPETAGIEARWKDHRLFLKKAVEKEVFVKVVVNEDTRPDEFGEAVRIVKDAGVGVPLVIQAASPCKPQLRDYLLDLHELAARELKDVRIIPQTHKLTGML